MPEKLTVVSAGSASQMASWEEDSSHGLFTKHYQTGLSDEADKASYGNGDGTVDWTELENIWRVPSPISPAVITVVTRWCR